MHEVIDAIDINSTNIIAAAERIREHVIHTPITESKTLSDICGVTALFKLENLQMTGSFKERGAIYKLLGLSAADRKKGIIAASAGNHAQALAYHGQRLGISVKIVMPRYSPIVKIRSTEHWGANVVLAGENFDEAYAHSQDIVAEEGRVYVHPFDDPEIVIGQGTIGLEVFADPSCHDLDAVLVPIGGGGLIAGIATYIKSVTPHIQIIGVEESSCNAMYQSLQAGTPVHIEPSPVIADGIAVRHVSARNLKIIGELVDEVVSVSSDEIANAIMLMLEIEKYVIEGAAATALAALVNNRLPQLKGCKVLSIISGGNIDVNLLSRIIERGLTFDGRVARIETVILDRPGGLEKLLSVIREAGANVIEVHHHRFSSIAPIGQVGVSITIETKDRDHLAVIHGDLARRGYIVQDRLTGKARN